MYIMGLRHLFLWSSKNSGMETFWSLLLVSLSFCIALPIFIFIADKRRRLPPGPPAVLFIRNLIRLRRRSILDIEPLLRDLHVKYGPIVSLRMGTRTAIFIADRHLAHKALIEHGATFSDRPTPFPASRSLSSNQHNISSAAYGPLWRLLRRNLISEILHPSRVKIYAAGRRWVLKLLSDRLNQDTAPVKVMENFQFAMFCLLVLMCFGEKLDEKAIREIEVAQRNFLFHGGKLHILAYVPRFTQYLFRKRLTTALEMRRRQLELYVPLIGARREHKKSMNHQENDQRYVHSYLDSLLDIQLPEEGGRGLTEDEIVSLCSEFLNAGTDTTSTSLQWIMANLVKFQDIQKKLADEIEGSIGSESEEVREEDLERMPYLKAVVMEGLRRHPPGHFVLPHAVTKEMTIEGYTIPKGASVNFMVAKINMDEKVWEEPMEFKPERFVAGGEGEGMDIAGNKEVKMMPFGVGRRICPASGLAMLHLEYFVANLVREFEWKAVEGEEVDLSEKQAFTVVMKNPLRASLVPRRST